ncbi:MAG: T9SS type A sorting domain-containing protein [Candidatus Cloacimonetes bacterium]|nr:T9SS type A sorting domain-containing protein [Candidatus Cloacimonadota bacterium]
MKKLLLLVLCLSFLVSAVYAKEMKAAAYPKAYDVEGPGRMVSRTREVPAFTFTKTPTSLMVNYYDYMIGSYNGLPIRVIPDPMYPGYFMTYHGKRTPTGTRRAFYAHLDAQGNMINNNEITAVNNNEGYPTVAVDPVSGKPLYAWHANASGDTDAELEVEYTSDAFIGGISGLFNDIQVIADNPIAVTPGVGDPSTDNEFIWPTAQIGPSPVAGMRRVYVAMRNYVTHNTPGNPSENLYIAYADFNGDMLEGNVPLQWNHTSIPEMDQWNHDPEWRRPFHALTTDNQGNVYYAGYHIGTESDGTTSIIEDGTDIFVNDNYGEGTWTRISGSGQLPSWNPAGTPGGTGYFVGEGDVPYPDDEMVWSLANSSHLNAVTTPNGRVVFPGVWAQSTIEGGYWVDFQVVKSLVWNPLTNEFAVNEIFPQINPDDTFNSAWTPWDLEAPWGEPEYYQADDEQYYLNPEKIWPFPHWDESLHTDAMEFHYNNIKVSEVNDQNMLVAVWQDCMRAKAANVDNDPDYAEFSQVPEIYISVSSNGGDNWTEPIVLNSVETPEFDGIKPMWVYPADQVIYVGPDGENKIGKIGMMFYNDYTWGSYANTPPAHPNNDGGEVMFMEMQIVFPPMVSNANGTAPAVTRMLNPNYPNPFNPETTISFDMPKAGQAKLDIYNVKGQLVKSLFNGSAPFGKTSMVWNGTDSNGRAVTSGVYFYRLSTEGHSETRKMMLMK